MVPKQQQTLEITPDNGNGLVLAERQPAALTPVELLRIAVSQGADIEKLKQLMDLQERWEKNEARKAFVAAMNKFKANPPQIRKNNHVHFTTAKGPTDYDHATLSHVCEEVTKGLSAVGISHSWRTKQEGGVIAVICVLTHEMGHSEETQLMGSADDSGGKNSIQAIGSTVTYLQRYTLLSACGLAAGADTDGQTSGKTILDATELQKNLSEIAGAKDVPSLKFLFTCAADKARELGDQKALGHYIAAKDKRYREVQNASH